MGGFINFDDLVILDDGKFYVMIVFFLDIFWFIFYLFRIMRGKFYMIFGIIYFIVKCMKIKVKEKFVGIWIDGDMIDDFLVELFVVLKGLVVYLLKKEE